MHTSLEAAQETEAGVLSLSPAWSIESSRTDRTTQRNPISDQKQPKQKNKNKRPNAYNFSIHEAEAGGLKIQGQPEVCWEI